VGIFGGLFRGFSDKPPKLEPGEVVRFASVPSPGIFAGSLPQRPYAVKLDGDHQEVGDRRWIERQVFTNPDYMGAWQAWVEAQGALPQPPFPDGAV